MERARRSTLALLVVALIATGLVALATPGQLASDPTAAVVWPPSTGLLLAEVVTGGASASDEFIELTNAGPNDRDLMGLEMVYVTSTGGTATRKATWASTLMLPPGGHLLVANSGGSFAATADATYTGGLAPTGGAIVLRPVGGSPIDAVAWGDARNAFIEATATAAPAAGQSIERRPGGTAGNGIDTNNNVADWFVQPNPEPQNRAAPPTPSPTSTPGPTVAPNPSPPSSGSPSPSESSEPSGSISPTPAPTPVPTPVPSLTATPEPSAPPSEQPSPVPTGSPTPNPTDSPTPSPTPSPTATPSPTPSPTATPSPTPFASPAPTDSPPPSASDSPTPTPTPTPIPTPAPPMAIAAVRLLADGQAATLQGVLTTALGALDSGHTAFIQDASGGVALYVDPSTLGVWPRGSLVRATGSVDDRYGQRVLRVAPGSLELIGSDVLPAPVVLSTGAAGEGDEGARAQVEGIVQGAPSAVSDGLSLAIDDGTGALRVIVTLPAAQPDLVTGARIRVVGPLGQHAGSTGGGYRVYATEVGDLEIVAPPPTPTPKPTLTPRPTVTPTPTGSPIPSPSSSASPTPTPIPGSSPSPSTTGMPSPSTSPSLTPTPSSSPVLSIAAARALAVGARVRVRGIVMVEAGRLGDAALIAIGDADAGIVVRMPAGSLPRARGASLIVDGTLVAPYGQLEIRPTAGGLVPDGTGVVPAPFPLNGALDESAEGRLVVVEGRLDGTPTTASAGDLSAVLVTDSGARLSIHTDASSGIRRTDLVTGSRYRLTGIAGQRATAIGRADGYRIWLRDPADIVPTEGPGPGPSGSPSGTPAPTGPSPSPSPSPCPSAGACPTTQQVVSIGEAIVAGSGVLTIEGIVTTPPGLLDAGRRETVIQDRSGAILVRLKTSASPPAQGHRIRVTGAVGRAYGAPRITAQTIIDVGADALPATLVLKSPPNAAVEWRLVQISGTIVAAHSALGRWHADILMGRDRISIDGLASTGIPVRLLIVGRTTIVVGIARRPYPTATDRRFAIVPRSKADLRVGAMAAPGSTRAGASGGAAGEGGTTSRSGGRGGTSAGGGATTNRGELPGAGTSGPGGRNRSIDAPVDVDFAALGTRVGWHVRVGGLVVAVTGDYVTIDDGTTVGLVAVEGTAQMQLPSLRPGVAVNVVGLVRSDPDLAVVVSDPAGIVPVVDAVVDAGVVGVALPPLGSLSRDLAAADGSTDGSTHASTGEGSDSAAVGAGGALHADLGGVAVAMLLLLGAGVVAIKRRRLPVVGAAVVRAAMAHRVSDGSSASQSARLAAVPGVLPGRADATSAPVPAADLGFADLDSRPASVGPGSRAGQR